MAVSGHGRATVKVRRHCGSLCSGAGERRARRESEMERAAEARGLSFHAGLTDQVGTGVRLPHGMPRLPSIGH